MKKLKQLSTWLAVLPTAILSLALVLVHNGVSLDAVESLPEILIMLCAGLTAWEIFTTPDPLPDEEGSNEQKSP
jgi:hypothetical protein